MRLSSLTLLFVNFFALGLTLSSCKSLDSSSGLKKNPDYHFQADASRVNRSFEEATVANPDDGYTHWIDYTQNQDSFKNQYENSWKEYGDFLVSEDGTRAKAKCLTHRVHFILKPFDGSAADNPDAKATNCENKLNPNEYILSYNLFNYMQPNLVRNLLVLVKNSAFDNAEITASVTGLEVKTSKHFAGTTPFYILPDFDYSDREPTKEGNKDSEFSPFSDLSGASVFEPQINSNFQGSAVESYISAKIIVTGESFSTRNSFANYFDLNTKSLSELKKMNAFGAPIPYGRLVITAPNSIKNHLILKDMLSKNRLVIKCSYAEKIKESKYDSSKFKCPEVFGE